MRPHRRRTKKLTVAFHFQFGNQAAWRCDTCRKQGLEEKRNCGYLEGERPAGERLVWARGNARLRTCPRSYITPESLRFIERFQAAKAFGCGDPMRMAARDVDAFCLIETLLIAERRRDKE